jgi:hypothetical protein
MPERWFRWRASDARCPPEERHFTSESILNMGRYIEMTITPTIIPTRIIING